MQLNYWSNIPLITSAVSKSIPSLLSSQYMLKVVRILNREETLIVAVEVKLLPLIIVN